MMMTLLSNATNALELYRNDLACELGIAVGCLVILLIGYCCLMQHLKNEEAREAVCCVACLLIILLMAVMTTKAIFLGLVGHALEESSAAAVIENAGELLLQNRF